MSSKSAELIGWAVLVLVLGTIAYIWVAKITFKFRHPHMTETELFMHTADALKFNKVEDDE